MRCRLDDTPAAEDEASEQEEEERGLLGFELPEVRPREVRTYSCR